MSGPNAVPQVEVVASTRRRWSMAQRRTILAEAGQDGVTVSEVARRHGLSPSLLPYVRTLADRDRLLGWLDRFYSYFFDEAGGKPATPGEIYRLAKDTH